MRGKYAKKDWPKLVKLFRQGKFTRSEFSKMNGISESALDYHLRRKLPEAERQKSSFIEVSPDTSTGGEIVLELPLGIKLTIRK